jgi:N-acetylmuramoyl-L-alanine amidase
MRRLFLSLLLALLPPGLAAAAAQAAPATTTTWHVTQFDQRRYVPISDVAAFYRMHADVADAKGFRLSTATRVLEGRAGNTEVRINGVKYVTCFPVRTSGGRVYLSAMDVTKIIEPLMRPGKIKGVSQIRTIVLDAGHGGHDSGAVGPYGREKDYTLDVVLRARALLLRAGFQVKTTRLSDTFIPLEDRAAFANRFPGALFISVHFNKSNTGGTGIETYALAPRGVPSMDEGSLRYSDFKLNPGNARDAENIALAACIHSMMVRNLRVFDRGIKRARFVVIKNITIPGVLIEGGFVDNPTDSRLIATPAYRQRIADSILAAATAYTRTINGAAPQPSALVTVGPSPTATPADIAAPEPLAEDEIAAPTATPRVNPTPTPSAPTAPAFNPGNPAFGRPPAPFDRWTQPPLALPFTTVNPAASRAISAPPPQPTATPSQLEKPARPHRDFAPKEAAPASTEP